MCRIALACAHSFSALEENQAVFLKGLDLLRENE